MKAFEQIAICYQTCEMYNLSITYYKKSLQISYELRDTMAELNLYYKLGQAYANAGDPIKMVAYHKRAFHGLLESDNSAVRQASKAMSNVKKRCIPRPGGGYSIINIGPKKLHQCRGLDAEDVDRLALDFS
jgi:tetratricopeptide (TPR) repeat protein